MLPLRTSWGTPSGYLPALVGRPVTVTVWDGVSYMLAMPHQKQPETLAKLPEKSISSEPALAELAQFKQHAAQRRCADSAVTWVDWRVQLSNSKMHYGTPPVSVQPWGATQCRPC